MYFIFRIVTILSQLKTVLIRGRAAKQVYYFMLVQAEVVNYAQTVENPV